MYAIPPTVVPNGVRSKKNYRCSDQKSSSSQSKFFQSGSLPGALGLMYGLPYRGGITSSYAQSSSSESSEDEDNEYEHPRDYSESLKSRALLKSQVAVRNQEKKECKEHLAREKIRSRQLQVVRENLDAAPVETKKRAESFYQATPVVKNSCCFSDLFFSHN